jgi:hypothetical protein
MVSWGFSAALLPCTLSPSQRETYLSWAGFIPGKKNNCYDPDVSVNIMRRSGERLARGWLTMYHSGNGKWLENRRSIVI